MPLTKNHRSPAKSGFTIIEVIMVLGLSVLILMSVTTLFITSLASRAKGNISHLLKEEGTQALNRMTFMIRNSKALKGYCDDPTAMLDEIAIEARDGTVTVLKTETDAENKMRIASNSAYLTSSTVTLRDPETGDSTLTFNCEEGFEHSGQYITIDFSLFRTAQDGTTNIQENFSAGVQVRNATGTQ